MKNFSRNGSAGPKKNFGGSGGGFGKKGTGKFAKPKNSGSSPYNANPQMHEATCGSCGKTCGVPFKPNGKKPVYCSLCFKKGNYDGAKKEYVKKDFHTPYSSAPSASNKKEFEELNRKLDAILGMLAGK